MATNKVITVTVIPTRTGDTVASYNAYSSVDGLLGSLSVAEAAAGKTFALSDGSSHNITVKTVWTTVGESTANVSNIVVVDLSATDILFQDDFTGTTIDTGKWDIINTVPNNVSITQNDSLIFTQLVDNVSDGGFAHYVIGKTAFTGSETRCLQVSPTLSDAAKTFGKFGYHDGTVDNQIYIDHLSTTSPNAQLTIRLDGVTEYQVNSNIPYDGNTFKIEIVGTTIKFYYYNAGWTQVGTTQTFDFTGKTLRPALEGKNYAEAGAINQTMTFDNFYESNEIYTGAIPV